MDGELTNEGGKGKKEETGQSGIFRRFFGLFFGGDYARRKPLPKISLELLMSMKAEGSFSFR